MKEFLLCRSIRKKKRTFSFLAWPTELLVHNPWTLADSFQAPTSSSGQTYLATITSSVIYFNKKITCQFYFTLCSLIWVNRIEWKIGNSQYLTKYMPIIYQLPWYDVNVVGNWWNICLIDKCASTLIYHLEKLENWEILGAIGNMRKHSSWLLTIQNFIVPFVPGCFISHKIIV